jgi:hypothetical protein
MTDAFPAVLYPVLLIHRLGENMIAQAKNLMRFSPCNDFREQRPMAFD